MANNNSSSICWQSDSFFALGDRINFTQFAIILPIYATVGLFGHAILVAVFLKQAQNEKAYVYQIFLEIMECLDNLVFTLFLLSFLGGGIFGGGYEWYQKVYFLMWYTAHMALPLVHGFSMACLLLSVSMAADRLFALMKPFTYKNINRKMHQIVALTLSTVLGFGTTFYNVRLFEVQNGQDRYLIGVDIDFVVSLTSTILSHGCNVARMVGLLALIVCNVSLVSNFKKYTAQMTKLTNVGQLSENDKKREARERSTEKSLLLLTISQSFFTAVTMFSYVLFYTAAYTVPLFNFCDHVVYAPLLDSVLMMCDLGKTVVLVALNRKTREMLFGIFCWKHIKIGTTTTATKVTIGVLNNRQTVHSTTFL